MRKRKLTVHEEWLVEIEKMPLESRATAYRDLMLWMVGDSPSDLIRDVIRKNRKGNPNFVKGSSNPYFAPVEKKELETRAVAPMGKGVGIKDCVPKVEPIVIDVKESERTANREDEAYRKPNGIDVYDYLRKAGITPFRPEPFLRHCERREWKWKDGTPLDWHEAARRWSEWEKEQNYKKMYGLAE